MDVVQGLLDGVRAHGAFVLRTLMEPPWCMRIEDEAAITVFAVVSGHLWVTVDGAEPRRMDRGDVAIARGPDHYTVGDHPDTPADILISPGQRCTTLNGSDLAMSMSLGVRTWGNTVDASTVLLTGTYEESTEISRRLLGELPPLAIVCAAQWRSPLVDLLATEIAEDSPGQVAVLDRLLDLILVSALRTWFDTEQSGAPLWWTADSDPLIGPALRMIYDDPARAWTIAALAREVGISRAGFARRFTQTVGEPPMAFITRLRLAVAADLLRNDDMTIAAVARDVGYASPFALSTAFKREFGVSPHQHRVAHTATPQTSAPSSATASRAMRPTAT